MRAVDIVDIAGLILLMVLSVLISVAIGTLVALIPAVLFMLGWNMFAVPVLHMPEVTFWQALGASILLGLVRGAVLTYSMQKKHS
jgi:hypothetical protein